MSNLAHGTLPASSTESGAIERRGCTLTTASHATRALRHAALGATYAEALFTRTLQRARRIVNLTSRSTGSATGAHRAL